MLITETRGAVTTKVAGKCSTDAAVFPVETIYHILRFLSPQEIALLQGVSKQFHAIANDRALWKVVYANANLPRPPGPFPWQSTKFLRHALVQSARLEKRWTSEPINVVSRHSLTLGTHASCDLVCGRWLIIREDSRLLSHDLDTGTKQTLCEWEEFRSKSWSATCSTTSTGGRLVYVGICTRERVKLLEFQADDESGQLSGPVSYDVPIRYRGGEIPLQVSSGDTQFVSICVDREHIQHSSIFDALIKTFYSFPALPPEINVESLSHQIYYHSLAWIVLTATHIITFLHINPFGNHLVQAYVVPDDSETYELRVSHETLIRSDALGYGEFSSRCLAKTPSIDPISKSIHLRFLIHSFTNLAIQCFDLVVLERDTERVMLAPMNSHVVLDTPDSSWTGDGNIVETSIHGLIRGLCIARIGASNDLVRRYTIDATGERCVGVLGEPSLLSPSFDVRWCDVRSFHGPRGRICYTVDMEGMLDVVVLDLE